MDYIRGIIEMIKKFISMICLTLILATVNSTSFAYSTGQYDIEIPDSFIPRDENDTQDYISSFVSAENENFEIYIVFREDVLSFDISEENLGVFMQIFKPEYTSTTVTSEITTFTKNNYKCFHYDMEIPFCDTVDYMETYVTKSGIDYYFITLVSDKKELLELESTKDIINSFTIADYSF